MNIGFCLIVPLALMAVSCGGGAEPPGTNTGASNVGMSGSTDANQSASEGGADIMPSTTGNPGASGNATQGLAR